MIANVSAKHSIEWQYSWNMQLSQETWHVEERHHTHTHECKKNTNKNNSNDTIGMSFVLNAILWSKFLQELHNNFEHSLNIGLLWKWWEKMSLSAVKKMKIVCMFFCLCLLLSQSKNCLNSFETMQIPWIAIHYNVQPPPRIVWIWQIV